MKKLIGCGLCSLAVCRTSGLAVTVILLPLLLPLLRIRLFRSRQTRAVPKLPARLTLPTLKKFASAVSAIEAVNAIPNPRTIDDFAVENDMGLSLDDLIAYQGDVTNNQSDCALVFVAQVKDGAMDTVKGALEAYRDSMTSSLYVDEAAKVAKAEDARIVTSGNFVVDGSSPVSMVPDYADIDTAH